MFKSLRFLFLILITAASLVLGPVTSVKAGLYQDAQILMDFSRTGILVGETSTLKFEINNTNDFWLENVSFTNNLTGYQAGLEVAPAGKISNTCEGVVIATPGSNVIILSGGRVKPYSSGQGTCAIEVEILAKVPGSLQNYIPTYGSATTYGGAGLYAIGNGGLDIITNGTQNPTVVTLLVLPVGTPSMSKRFTPTTVWAGQTTEMQIDIMNTDSQNGLSGATYTDTLPGDFVVASPLAKSLTGTGCTGTIDAVAGGKTVTLRNGVVPKGTTCVLHVNVVSSTQGVFINTIPKGPDGSGSLQTNQFVTNALAVTAQINVQAIGMTKVFNPTSFAQGDTSTLTITLRNPTSSPYTGQGFDDILPGTLVVTGSPAATQCGGAVTISSDKKTISLNNGTVPPGTSTTPGSCTVVVQVTSPTPGGAWTNYIELADIRGIKPLTRVQSNNVTVVARTIGVTKSFGVDFIENGTTSLTITLSNPSSIAFTGVNFSDPLEGYPNISYVGTPTASSGCGTNAVASNTGQTLSLSNAVIPAVNVNTGTSGTCVITATVTSSTPASYSNTLSSGAVCSTTQNICNASSNSDTVVVNPMGGNASVSKSFNPKTIGPGSTSSLTFTITAPLDTPLSQIYLRDNLPDDMVVVSVPNSTPCNGSLNAPIGSQIIELSGGAIASAKGTCTFSVNVTSFTPGTHANSIPGRTLTTYEGRTDPNPAQDSLTVNSFTGYKTFTPAIIAPGGLSLLTIFLENTSLLPITSVTLTDDLASMDYVPEGYQVRVYNPDTAAYTPTTDCGGSITASDGASSIGLSGATIPASDGTVSGLCRVNVYVKGLKTSVTLRKQTNNISTDKIFGQMQSVGIIYPRSFTGADLTIKTLNLFVDKGFNPTGVYNGSASLLTFDLVNGNDVPLTGIKFTDDMPDGMILATPTDFNVGTCGGTLTAHDTDPSIFYFSGGSLLPSGKCKLTLKVTSTVTGVLTNTIFARTVSSFEGATNPDDAPETLGNATSALITKSFSPNPVGVGNYSLLTITISNVNTLIALTGMNLDDTLPTGLKIASDSLSPAPPPPTTDCGGVLTVIPDPITPVRDLIRLLGGTLPASTVSPSKTSSCTIVVAVTGPAGTYQNVIPDKALVTNETITNNDPAEDTLVITSYSLGNRVWDDQDGDGTQDAGEPGFSGVTVNLYLDSDNSGAPDGGVVATKTTDSNGYYRFDGLSANTFIVEARIPTGYAVSVTNGGDPDTTQVDDDNNGVNTASNSGYVRSDSVTLSGTDEPTGENNPALNPDIINGEGLDNQSNRTVDFGFYSMPFSLGNRVWNDQDGDGIQDAGEPGLNGVTVRLYRDHNIDNTPDGTFINFMTTDANGYYRFDNLYADSYIVEAVTPAGYRITSNAVADPNNNNDTDHNGYTVNGVNVRSQYITLGPTANEPINETNPSTNPDTADGEAPDNQSNRTLDFGFNMAYSLGNRVWDDNGAGTSVLFANNGFKDGTEPGLGGVTVKLYLDHDDDGFVDGAVIATQITDGNGYYRFDGLNADTYIVEVVYPAGYAVSTTNGGDPDTVIVDNDNNGVVGGTGWVRSNPVTLGSGAEPTLDNDPSTNPMTGEAPDAYSNRTVDFGLYHLPLSLGNLVWLDNGGSTDNVPANINNGKHDANEPGLSGVTVKLYRVGEANPLIISETDANGNYLFSNLTEGNYTVEVTIPTGYTNSSISFDTPNDLTDDDNNGSTLAGTKLGTATISLTNLTGDNLRVDFGLVSLASLGDRVWYDTNRNGIQDAGEQGVTGVTVKLYTGTPGFGTLLLPAAVTGGGGTYNFSNLIPSDYYLEFTLPANYKFSPTSSPGVETTDNDAILVPSTIIGRTGTIGLSAFENDTSWDAGIYLPPSSIGDKVWNDTDRDGIQDGGELGIPNVTVELYRPGFGTDGIAATADDGLPVATKLTDASVDHLGDYLFNELLPGTYHVIFTLPDGYAFTTKNASGSTTSNDSNADTTTGQTANIVLSVVLGEGTTDLDWDAGLYQLASIGDFVWLDNGAGAGGIAYNGIQDGTEAGIPGVAVNLYDNTNPLVPIFKASTSTASDGKYQFTNLEPGDYYVEFSLPSGYAFSPKNAGGGSTDSDADIATGKAVGTTLGIGENDMTWDAGLYQTAAIGDKFWDDNGAGGGVARNGIQDGTEPGIPGRTVKLYNSFDVQVGSSTTTDGNGLYSFSGLVPAEYYVEFSLPSGYAFSPKNADGSTVDKDSDAIPATPTTGKTSRTILGPGENDPTWDAGAYLQPASIGDYVWLDTNGNGIQNNGEPLISGVTVTLYDAQNQVVGTTTTGADGKYLFNLLNPGYYYLGFTAPANHNFTLTGQGTGSTDSDAVVPLGKTNLTLLEPGENDMTWDAGLYTKASLGNFVWLDWNVDGIQDSGEPGINGVSVELFRVGVGSIGTTTTANSGPNPGFYLFDNLVPGDYYVVFTLPSGYIFSPQGSGTTATDSNPASTGTTASVSLASGAANLTVDAGLIPLFALGNRVWFDANNNGSIDAGETGVPNVRVQLYKSDGTTEVLVGPDGDLNTADAPAAGGMLTDANGYYLFNNLPPGNYKVILPASNFSGVLNGYWSSYSLRNSSGNVIETSSNLANGNIDLDDNGDLSGGRIESSVVTLGLEYPAAEPLSETVSAAGQGGRPDEQANMTVDFGFYTTTLGNMAWIDADNNGLLNGGEVGKDGVDIELRSGDGSTLLASTTTAGGGLYLFIGMPAGNYMLRIPAAEFNPGGILRDYVSSTGLLFANEPAPSADFNTVDANDNGTAVPPPNASAGPDGTYNSSLGLGGFIQTAVFTLTSGAEDASSSNISVGLTNEPRIDFGLYANALTDLSVIKVEVPNKDYYSAGSTLNYTITVTNNGPSDVTGAKVVDALPPQIASWTWTCAAGNPALSNCTGATANSLGFQDFIDLKQKESLTYNVVATVAASTSGVLTNSVIVATPAGVAEIDSLNNTASDVDQPAALQVTKDDSLTIVGANSTITYQIVVTNNGLVDLTTIKITDDLPGDLTFVSATPAPDTRVGNLLTWSGRSLTIASSMTITVTATVSATPAATITNVVNVLDTTTGASATGSDIDSTASQPNNNLAKQLFGTDAIHTTSPNIAIGEILTYQVVMSVPVGSMTNAILVDVPQSGLAFVDLTSLTVSDPDTDDSLTADSGLYSSRMTFDPVTGACTNCASGTNSLTANPLIENSGGKVTFKFETLTNSSAAVQTITILYRVIVLDISANRYITATALTNNALWTWTGGSLTAAASAVKVVEPDMSIDKKADTTLAPYGAAITFTLDIAHTVNSSADAFDVVITDKIPAGLEFVPKSVTCVGLEPTTTSYDSLTKILTIVWDEFPLTQKSSVSFKTVFAGPSPVLNESNVAWTSLPIDPGLTGPVLLSVYNPKSTERWYDPADAAGLNGYGAKDSITIVAPPVPGTGFAPGMLTELSTQPADQLYSKQGDIWLEIPELGLKMPIVGVPLNGDNGWNLTWLADQAGWLEGTAYPSHPGNSVITAHLNGADGEPGPFINLNRLYWGHKVILHINGLRYIYEVRESRTLWPEDKSVFKHEEYSWLTLITCKDYVESSNAYSRRLIVRAVLVRIE